MANEYVAARAGVLKSNLERMGVTNALVLNESTARVAAAFPAFFDKVLVDAPCSGEGMFRKEPEALRQHSAALVAQCAAPVSYTHLVDRCRLLLHVVDVSGSEGRDPKDDFEKINTELANFSQELSARPQIVLGNKCDIASPEQIAEFRAFIEEKGLVFLPVSAATRQGLDKLPGVVYERLQQLPPVTVYEPE